MASKATASSPLTVWPAAGGRPPPDRVADLSPMAEEPFNRTGGREDRVKVTRVVSAHINVLARLVEIWRSRELLVYLVRTEIKVKYKNSVLGLVWSMVAPAMTLAVYTVVFGVFLKNGIPNFVIFLFSGLLLWNFFQTGVIAATGVVVNNAGLVKKVSFPREILALAAIGSAGVFLFFQICVMAIFMLVVSNAPAWGLTVAAAGGVRALCGAALRPWRSAGLGQRLPAGHPAPDRGAGRGGLVLGLPDRVLVPAHGGGQAVGPHGLTWLYFLNPMTPLVMTFQRVLYNQDRHGHPDHRRSHATRPRLLPSWPARPTCGRTPPCSAVGRPVLSWR